MTQPLATAIHLPWNKGKLTGQKAPLPLNEIYAIRAALIYRRTPNMRAVQLLLRHAKIESTIPIWALNCTTRWNSPSRGKCETRSSRRRSDDADAHRGRPLIEAGRRYGVASTTAGDEQKRPGADIQLITGKVDSDPCFGYNGDPANVPSVSPALAVRVLNASDVLFRDSFETVSAGCSLQ